MRLLQRVVPTAFVLTNYTKRCPKNYLGLAYYFDSGELPFHTEWFNVLDYMAEYDFSINHSAKAMCMLPDLKWRPAKHQFERDLLAQDGYNYVGFFPNMGPLIRHHAVNLPGDKAMSLLTAMTVMLVFGMLDDDAVANNPFASRTDRQYIAAYITYALDTLRARRLLNDVKVTTPAERVAIDVSVKLPDFSWGEWCHFSVLPSPKGFDILLKGGATDLAYTLQRILYLPGTKEFKRIALFNV